MSVCEMMYISHVHCVNISALIINVGHCLLPIFWCRPSPLTSWHVVLRLWQCSTSRLLTYNQQLDKGAWWACSSLQYLFLYSILFIMSNNHIHLPGFLLCTCRLVCSSVARNQNVSPVTKFTSGPVLNSRVNTQSQPVP